MEKHNTSKEAAKPSGLKDTICFSFAKECKQEMDAGKSEHGANEDQA